MSDKHTYAEVLNSQEKALYLSAVEDVVTVVEHPEREYNTDVEFDPESPKLTETTRQVGAANTILKLIGEVARERKHKLPVYSDHTQTEEK